MPLTWSLWEICRYEVRTWYSKNIATCSAESCILGTSTNIEVFKEKQELMYILGVRPRTYQSVTPHYSMANWLSYIF